MSIIETLPNYIQEEIQEQVKTLRNDLLAIPQAEADGWVVSFKKNSWHNPASFEKNGVSVWLTSIGWKAADLVDGYYKNHRTYESLTDALEGG